MRKIFIGLLASLMLVACTQKREVQFAQGHGGSDLKSISDFDNKYFELSTQTAIGNTYNSKASNIEVESGKAINNFPMVNYATDAKLLDDVPFIGKENSKYQILYKLTEAHLVIYKVGKEEDIAIQERASADKLDDGRLAVPLMGYPVRGYYKLEFVKNSDNEDTNTLIEVPVDSKAQATHFKLDFNQGEIFRAVQKVDVFPVSMLEGEWYFAETVIKAPEKHVDAVGQPTSVDAQMKESTRIHFQKYDDQIHGINSNIDERVKDSENLNSGTVIKIPVQWKAYKNSKRGKILLMSEEEDTTISWKNRPYVSMNFEGVIANFADGQNFKVTEVKVADDYFSFTLLNTEVKYKTRYSFMKVKKSDYVPRNYFLSDAKRFGYFTSEKEHLVTLDTQKVEDLEKFVNIVRFNPKKDIVYHFTKTTPQWVRPAVRESFEAWNNAFKQAGVDSNIILDESFDVDLGDIRYSAINIIETVSSTDLFGVGPSLVEASTGEIISAITNIHMTTIVDETTSRIQFFVNREGGMYKGLSIFGIKVPGLEFLGKSRDEERLPYLGFFEKEIRDNCPEVVAYSQSEARQSHSTQEQINFLRPCGKKLALEKMKGTLVHEMGHNFGLRHNFLGSVDAANFWPNSITKTSDLVRSSSVMEYADFKEDRLIIPGPYDIAAIRYGYSNQVETQEGKIISINPKLALSKQLSLNDLRSFKYCTDENVSMNTKIDPLCNRHDKGTNAAEVVDHYTHAFNEIFLKYNFRFGKVQNINEHSLYEYKEENYIKPIVLIYYKWREHLTNYVGENKRYLEGISKEEYAKILQGMSQDPNFAQIYAEYKPAADKAFRFFMALANSQPKFCIARDIKQNVTVVDFEPLRKSLHKQTGITANSCYDQVVTEHLIKKGLTVEFGGGHFLKNTRHDISDENSNESLDILGIELDRRLGLRFLIEREQLTRQMKESSFEPAFVDEPQYREEVQAFYKDRILNGVRLSTYGLKSNQVVKKFSHDKELVSWLLGAYFNVFEVPGSIIGNAMRAKMMNVDILTDTSKTSKSDLIVKVGDIKARAKKEDTIGYEFLSKFKELRSIQAKGESAIKKAGYENKDEIQAHIDILATFLRLK